MTADIYAVGSGFPIYGGCAPPAPPGITAAQIGDSLTTHRLGYNLSPYQWINGQAGGGMQLIANAGVAGENVVSILARVDNPYTNVNPGMAGLGPLGHIFFRAGTNDARAGTTAASLVAVYAALLNKLHTYATKVYILSVPPMGPSESGYVAKNALTIEYNVVLANFAAANSSWCIFINDSVNLRAPDGSQLPGFFQPDGIHNAPAGTTQEGIDGYIALAPILAGYAYPRAQPDPALTERFTNPTFVGTAGTKGGTFTGTVVTGLSIGANGGGIGADLWIEAAIVDDADQSPWQCVGPTQVTAGGGASLRITSLLSGPTFTGSDPAVLEMMIEIDMRAFDSTYFSSMRLWVQGSAGVLTDDLELKIGGGPLTKKVMLRTKMPRPNALSSSAETLFFDLPILANHTGAMGNFRFRHIHIGG